MIDASATAGVVWKQESARIVAGVLRLVHDVGLAEELAQDALVAALEQWPVTGTPDNPGAWLTTIAKRRAVDHLRRSERLDRTREAVARELEQSAEPRDDDVLRLMFTACHPVLPAEARVALTLRVVAGLTTAEIARAFLVAEPVIAQRIAAAKRTLAEHRVAYEPAGRLASVLEVVYLIFNEGYAASSGDQLIRADLCLEALRLGRLLAGLAPDEAEAHGLVALMEIQQSRAAARTGPGGQPVPLHEQNRGRWDPLLIRRGFAAMLRAREAGGPPGPYVLQAAIAVCHAQPRTAAETDWDQIATLYAALERLLPTPVVRLNRAVAVGFAQGPQAGLDLLDSLRADPKMADYHLLPGVRGDLLLRLGRQAEARLELQRAASLTRNSAERDFLLRRVPERAAGPIFGAAVTEFLAGLSPATARAYGATLRRIAGESTPVGALGPERVAEIFALYWSGASARGWNRHVAAVRSFSTWLSANGLGDGDGGSDAEGPGGGLAAGVGFKPVGWGPRPVAAAVAVDLGGSPLRERVLWTMLRESAAPVAAVLALDVPDLDLDDRRARNGVAWRAGTARLLPELIAGRTRGPLFLSDRRPGPGRRPAEVDLCPETGRRRLSYERAEYLCKRATGLTLGRLRHSG